jgi:SPX domain protein involved in polyphosphate accumulation
MLRYERKYLVPYEILDSLRSRVKPFVRPDIYANGNGNGNGSFLPQYTVRSIYFDTRNLECHQEKTEGVELRKKFRIRTYNDYSDEAVAVFEIKKKIENRIQKHRSYAEWEDVPRLMETADIEKYIQPDESGQSLEDASRFFFHVFKRNLKPTVLVVYEREAYHGVFDPGVRITFDKNIRSLISPKLADMFKKRDLKQLYRNHFILEIKYFTPEMPIWAKSLVEEFKLRHQALSKYTIGYDVHTQNSLTY